MSEQTGPSFGVVLATVWKVLCALLLIPFVIMLAYIAVQVIPADFMIGVFSIALIGGWLFLTLKLRG